jgi:hypothetical protein
MSWPHIPNWPHLLCFFQLSQKYFYSGSLLFDPAGSGCYVWSLECQPHTLRKSLHYLYVKPPQPGIGTELLSIGTSIVLFRASDSFSLLFGYISVCVSMLLPIIFFIVVKVLGAAAGQHTVSYNWAIDWVQASPDGFKRPVVGINGQWPCPPIEVNIGDEVEVIVRNKLKNETTAIHFHGLFQSGSNQMDGPAMITQCPIDAGSRELRWKCLTDKANTVCRVHL